MLFFELNETRADDNICVRIIHFLAHCIDIPWHMLAIRIELDGIAIALTGRIFHAGLETHGETTVNGKIENGITVGSANPAS